MRFSSGKKHWLRSNLVNVALLSDIKSFWAKIFISVQCQRRKSISGRWCWFLHCNGPLHIIQALVDIKSCQYYFAEWYQAILRQKQINNLDSKYLYLPKYKPDINHHLPNNNRPIRLLDTQEAIKHINRDKKKIIKKNIWWSFSHYRHYRIIQWSLHKRLIGLHSEQPTFITAKCVKICFIVSQILIIDINCGILALFEPNESSHSATESALHNFNRPCALPRTGNQFLAKINFWHDTGSSTDPHSCIQPTAEAPQAEHEEAEEGEARRYPSYASG